MENFKYAPGMPGYGYSGVDGSSGLSGLAIYFTSYDAVGIDITTIKNKIDHNLILSPVVASIPGYPTRKYQDGDIFIDISGKAYEINLSDINKFSPVDYDLSGTGLFVNSAIPGVERYSNYYPPKIIDTVNSKVTLSSFYIDYPAIIYGLESKEFARIEYSNTNPESIGRNPFSLFIGAGADADDAYALALVRDINNNTFRLGNLDDTTIRNVSLIFDVISLRQNKTNNEFTRTEDSETLITNHEVDANSLFTPVFIYDPSSFKSSIIATQVSISWDKRHFLGTNDISICTIPANLYFLEKPYNTYNTRTFNFTLTDPAIRPMVFPVVDVSGTLRINGLTAGKTYKSYITFFDKGWTRNSKTLNVAV